MQRFSEILFAVLVTIACVSILYLPFAIAAELKPLVAKAAQVRS